MERGNHVDKQIQIANAIQTHNTRGVNIVKAQAWDTNSKRVPVAVNLTFCKDTHICSINERRTFMLKYKYK